MVKQIIKYNGIAHISGIENNNYIKYNNLFRKLKNKG